MTVRLSMDASKVIAELDRLAKGPDPAGFEAVFMGGFAAADAAVHVITGVLKGSGHVQSSFDGHTWSATMSFARHPGIFELARHDQPTLNHPEGGHDFFAPAYQTDQPFKEEIYKFLGGEG